MPKELEIDPVDAKYETRIYDDTGQITTVLRFTAENGDSAIVEMTPEKARNLFIQWASDLLPDPEDRPNEIN